MRLGGNKGLQQGSFALTLNERKASTGFEWRVERQLNFSRITLVVDGNYPLGSRVKQEEPLRYPRWVIEVA